MRAGASASLNRTEVGVPVYQQAVPLIVPRGRRKVTIEMIQKAVSEQFGLDPGRLKEKTKVETVCYPGQIAMYLAREITGGSLPKIGHAFGGRHHVTVLNAVRNIEHLRRTNSDVNRLIGQLMDSLLLRQTDGAGESV